MAARDSLDHREPKEILKTELYLNASMIKRILNCSYEKALGVIDKGLKIEKEKNLFIIEKQRPKKIRTETFKEIFNIWKVVMKNE